MISAQWASAIAAFCSFIAAAISCWIAVRQFRNIERQQASTRIRALALCREILHQAMGTLIELTSAARSPMLNVTVKARAEATYDMAMDFIARDAPGDLVQYVVPAKNAMGAIKALIGQMPGFIGGGTTILEPYGKEIRDATTAVEVLQLASAKA